jgi:hypothetical protein
MIYYTKTALEQLIQSAYKIDVFDNVDAYLRKIIQTRSTALESSDIRIIDIAVPTDDTLRIKIYIESRHLADCSIEPVNKYDSIALIVSKDSPSGTSIVNEIARTYYITQREMKHIEKLTGHLE